MYIYPLSYEYALNFEFRFMKLANQFFISVRQFLFLPKWSLSKLNKCYTKKQHTKKKLHVYILNTGNWGKSDKLSQEKKSNFKFFANNIFLLSLDIISWFSQVMNILPYSNTEDSIVYIFTLSGYITKMSLYWLWKLYLSILLHWWVWFRSAIYFVITT